MSWGCSTKTEIDLYRISKDDIDNKIEEYKEEKKNIENRILSYFMTTPRSKKDEMGYEMEYIDWVLFEYNELIEEYEESISKLTKLYMVKNSENEIENF